MTTELDTCEMIVVKHIHIDPIQDLVHSDVGHSFRSAYLELFQCIDVRRKYITYRTHNHLPAILPNQILNADRGKAVGLVSSKYWYSKWLPKHQGKGRAILAA